MNKFKAFLDRKDIQFTANRYLKDALSAMAVGLFASLLIGLILKTLGEQTALLLGINPVSDFLVEIGTTAMGLMGAAIGAAVAHGLKSPPLVLFASIITGSAGAAIGGPAGAFVAAVFGAEFGKAVSKETKVDIIVTPAVTLIMGFLGAKLLGPLVAAFMSWLGVVVEEATVLQPFLMGIIVSVIMGLALTAPISSAALAIMAGLTGLSAGAATAGCCAQMIGFAVISWKENGLGGFVAQGLGTSMLQISNIVRNWWILLPPTLAAAVTGPISTCIFKMTNVPEGAGMGTSGLVGQIGTFASMGFSWNTLLIVALVHFILPAALALTFDAVLKKLGKIKVGDYKLDL
ncbi:MAG: PTS sugar transporter subunit IIC [Clostridiales bacterium]|nr:PTS sugar transporter subunit IIC [Clostridiales bacterium]